MKIGEWLLQTFWQAVLLAILLWFAAVCALKVGAYYGYRVYVERPVESEVEIVETDG